MIISICTLRAALMWLYIAGAKSVPYYVIVALAGLPYIAVVSLYTLLIFAWVRAF